MAVFSHLFYITDMQNSVEQHALIIQKSLEMKVKDLQEHCDELNGRIIEAHSILMQMESLDELPQVFEALGYQSNGLSKY